MKDRFIAERCVGPVQRDTATQRSAASPRTVLVVDDESLFLRVVALGLRDAGYEATTCSRPLEALKLIATKRDAFDALVTDLLMPSMSGIELARSVRIIAPTIRIIVHSSLRPDATSARLFDVWIPKVGSLEPLIRALSS